MRAAPDRVHASPRVNRWGLVLLAVVVAGFSLAVRDRLAALERRCEVLSWRVESIDRMQPARSTGALSASQRQALKIMTRSR